MPEIKEYSPTVIEDIQFPNTNEEDIRPLTGTGATQDNLAPTEIPERTFPTQTIANSVISDSFNTQSRRILSEYSFGESGSLQIGSYEQDISGDVRISPSGIIARNNQGETTFTLDGSTGDATFKGTIAAGSLIAGRTDIGVENGNVYIDGEEVRIIISDGTNDRILIGRHVGGF